MFKRRELIAGIAAGAIGSRAVASAQTANPELPAVATTEPSLVLPDVKGSIQERIDAYLKRTGLDAPESSVSVLQGIGNVIVPSDHPQWVQHRTLAFEEAIIKAQQSYIGKQQVKISADAISILYKAADREPPPYNEGDLGDPGKVAEIARKALAVTGGTMDKALEQLGVDPRGLEKAPPAQKHIQFSRALAISGFEKSFGSLTGMIPKFSVEAHDGQGNYQIGVVALVSNPLRNLAQSVLRLRGNFTPDVARAQDFRTVVSDKAALVDLFGVRWMRDLEGLPVLVSFAQWGVERTGTKNVAMLAEYEDVALRQAEIRAGQQIAEFLSASGELESNAEFKKKLEETAERMADGYIAQKDPISSLEAPLRETMKRRARLNNLTGLETLAKWKRSHPDVPQHVIYGAVRFWSAAGEAGIRAQLDGRAAKATPGAGPTRSQAGTRESKDVGDF